MEYLIYAVIDGVAGFVRSVITGKGLIPILRIDTSKPLTVGWKVEFSFV